MRRTKIVCTLGPATSSDEQIRQLIEAGMDVARLNCSHGDHANHAKLFQTVRTQAEACGRSVAILMDLQGPKIRVGRFLEGQILLKPGAKFTITTDADIVGTEERVSTTYAGLPGDVKVGDRLLLDDGLLELAVQEVDSREVKTVVITGGLLKNNKGINLPGVSVSAPALTAKDKLDLTLAMRLGADYIALSFVRHADDIHQARKLATAGEERIPIIAKIEKPEAIEELASIIDAADGIMIARGDLGVELGAEKVPLIQKRIIEETNRKGKLVITATQMLESMMNNPRPTRAEASDVANAVLDGSDALMLSGETAAGDHPVESVRTMHRIIREVESSPVYRSNIRIPDVDMPVSANAIARAAVIAAKQMGLRTIAVVTGSGGAARLMSQYRPEAQIIALTMSESTYRQLPPYWGVSPLRLRPCSTTDELIVSVVELLVANELVRSGEQFVLTAGVPVGSGATTNMLEITTVP